MKKIYIIIGDSEEERRKVAAISKITRSYENPIDFIDKTLLLHG